VRPLIALLTKICSGHVLGRERERQGVGAGKNNRAGEEAKKKEKIVRQATSSLMRTLTGEGKAMQLMPTGETQVMQRAECPGEPIARLSFQRFIVHDLGAERVRRGKDSMEMVVSLV